MNSALVKIDVVAFLTGQSVSALFDRADGASLTDPSLMWVWDFSNGEERRDLRFWETEVYCPMEKTQRTLHALTLDEVIARILPVKRELFHAGEVDQLFQIRHNTRRDLLDSAGLDAGRNFYLRATLAEFLKARWLNGQRPANNFHPARAEEGDNRRGKKSGGASSRSSHKALPQTLNQVALPGVLL